MCTLILQNFIDVKIKLIPARQRTPVCKTKEEK